MYIDVVLGIAMAFISVVAGVVMLALCAANPVIGVPFLIGLYYFVRWLFRK